MMNGVNQITFFLLPMLNLHPDDIPRFRNLFLKDEEKPQYNNHLHVYTRVGGGNRNCGYGEDQLKKHPEYVGDFDDSFDSTFATYVFKIPEQWRPDYDKLMSGKGEEISDEYFKQMCKVFPKLEEKFKVIFKKE